MRVAERSALGQAAVVQQAGLSALDRWARIAVGWVIGTVAFGVVLVLPGDTLTRAALAPLVGVLSALLAMAVLGRGLHERADVGGR